MVRFEDIDWRSLTYEQRDRLLMERYAAYEKTIADRGGKRPKREGFIMERIANIDNLRAADHEAQLGKAKRLVTINGTPKRIPNKHIRRHNQNAEQELRDLQLMILTLDFPDPGFREERIKTDAGKVRDIIKQHFYPWHILEHAIMRVATPYIIRSLITDTCACIKGRGLHFGAARVKNTLRRHPELKWFWKTDYKKYYQSLPHRLVRGGFERLFKDKAFLRLIDIVILSYDSGEGINEVLKNEREKFERNPYRRYFKPDTRQSFQESDRPCNEAEREEESILQLLRRCDGVGKNKSRSHKGYAQVHRGVLPVGACGQSHGICLKDRNE